MNEPQRIHLLDHQRPLTSEERRLRDLERAVLDLRHTVRVLLVCICLQAVASIVVSVTGVLR